MTVPKDFGYNEACDNRLRMPQHTIDGIEYGLIVSNGFVKLYTLEGRAYWVAQTEQGHATPDWKFHVSVAHEDIAAAWDVLVGVFTANRCMSCAKAVSRMSLPTWPQHMRGRELTVYIPVNHTSYGEGIRMGTPDGPAGSGPLVRFADLERPPSFWLHLLSSIETAMKEAGIRSNGCADGDLSLGEFVSLRNEAYIPVIAKASDGSLIKDPAYPPNSFGWNAARHAPPIPVPQPSRLPAIAVVASSVAVAVIAVTAVLVKYR